MFRRFTMISGGSKFRYFADETLTALLDDLTFVRHIGISDKEYREVIQLLDQMIGKADNFRDRRRFFQFDTAFNKNLKKFKSLFTKWFNCASRQPSRNETLASVIKIKADAFNSMKWQKFLTFKTFERQKFKAKKRDGNWATTIAQCEKVEPENQRLLTSMNDFVSANASFVQLGKALSRFK